MAQTDARPNRETVHAGEHRVDVEPSPRWVRVEVNGETIADSKHVLLLRETRHLPVYYFPPQDVRMDLLTPTDHHTHCQYKGDASYWTLRVGDRSEENVVWSYQDPLPDRRDITGYLAFYWNRVDHWYEEEEEIFAHPRDPYHRVDVVPSSRHVEIVVNGAVVADTRQPRILFETGLPTRYYIPAEDIRMDLLETTETSTRCPYKGRASYWWPKGVENARDVAWSYRDPIPECPQIRELIAFFNERVDAIHVDGELQEKPVNHWS